MDHRYILFLQTPTAWIYRDSCLHHAMGYIDWWPKLHACHYLHWSYRRQRGDPRDYDGNFHMWHIRHCFTASTAFGATMLLYNCVLYGGCLAHYCLSVCGEEKLHKEMAEAIGILLLSPCAGFRQGPIKINYIDQASGINECAILASILF